MLALEKYVRKSLQNNGINSSSVSFVKCPRFLCFFSGRVHLWCLSHPVHTLQLFYVSISYTEIHLLQLFRNCRQFMNWRGVSASFPQLEKCHHCLATRASTSFPTHLYVTKLIWPELEWTIHQGTWGECQFVKAVGNDLDAAQWWNSNWKCVFLLG